MSLLAILNPKSRRSRRRRTARRNTILPAIATGLAAGVGGAVATHYLSKKNGRGARRNYDPNAVLRDIDDFLRARKSGDEVDYMVEDLYQWLQKGGFAPDWAKYPLGASYYQTRVAGARRKGLAQNAGASRNPLARTEVARLLTRARDVARSARRAKAHGRTEEAKKYLAYARGLLSAAHSFGQPGTHRAARKVEAQLHRILPRESSRMNPVVVTRTRTGGVNVRRTASHVTVFPRKGYRLAVERSRVPASAVGKGASGRGKDLVEVRRHRTLANRAPEQPMISIPFRQGGKYSLKAVVAWTEKNGTPAMKERLRKAIAQYRRFHKGALPKYVTYQTYKIGSHHGISDVEFGISEGREWMAAYQVPRYSGKWADKASDGRYVHAHGDSEIDVDVKRPVKLSKLPMRFHTPDGKSVGVIPSKNVKIGEWYEG